jgi:hypothetical protein
MSKRELIDAIIKHNRTAAPEFLARFAESELKAYLDRVCCVAVANRTNGGSANKPRELVAV